jgi:hypothetical protein
MMLNGAGADKNLIGKLQTEMDDCIAEYLMMMYQLQNLSSMEI